MSTLPPPAWHTDPTGRHELRYWDGTRWSEHVSDGGRVSADPLAAPAPVATTSVAPTPVAATPAITAPVAATPTVATEPARPVPLTAPPPSVPTAGTVPAAVPPPAGHPTAGAPPTMMRSIGGLAASITVLCWVTVAVSGFAAFAFANRAVVAGDILDFDIGRGGFTELFDLQQRADDADTFVALALVLSGLCTLTLAVLLIVWMWRVARNAELSGRVQPRFGAGWTIGGWCIPLANLVIPVLVMQDLWRASNPTVPRGDPTWRRSPGSALVGWWWAALLLASMRFGGGGDAESRAELEQLRTWDSVAAVGSVAAIAAAVLLALVVRTVTRRQESLLAGVPVTPA